MATLEIHDGRNQVRRVRITRENPVMFGSDPMCDVVLDGPGVQPFHGRIRWKTRRFKADASPEVPWIEVNGVQVKSKSLYQGDEIRIGACRIFLLSLEDGPDHGQKTVIQATPTTQGRPGRPGPADFHRMEMAPPSVEGPQPPPRGGTPGEPLPRTRHRKSNDFDDVEDALSDDRKKKKKGSISSLTRRYGERSAEIPSFEDPRPRSRGLGLAGLLGFDRAPGDERVLNSPIVIGLALTFALLVGFSVLLWGMIARLNASSQYGVATADMEEGNYTNAIKEFDQFLAANPTDKRAGKAKVLRALARVREHTGVAGASWGNALTQSVAMVDEVGSIEEYRDSSLELAEELRKIAEALADRAADIADERTLAEAESAVKLHARVAGPAAASLVERSKIVPKLAAARAAIQKSRDRASAIASMDEALKAEKPGDCYSSRDILVRRYPDLALDKEVAKRLIQANEEVQKAVSFDASGRPGEASPREEVLGPPTSLVLRLEPGKGPTGSSNAAVAFAVADGVAFGLDAATGAPRWQAPVGVASPFPPQSIAGDPPTALVVDARTFELTRRNARNGALIWRQALEGPVADPPLVLGNQVYQPTLDGRLIQLDLATGALRGTLHLGRELARTPVADDSGSHLYLLAEEDCLFVLSLDPLACVAVEYLGHELGSVLAAPARAGRFYILAENTSIDEGRWRVFVIDESGLKLKFVQELPVGGWTHSTPSATGPVIWSASDRGELVTYSIGLSDAKVPFTTVARIAPGTELEGPAYSKARTERDFWLASSRSGRFELDPDRGKLTSGWTRREAGPALAPPQLLDKTLVLTQQDEEGLGTALWGLDPASGDVRWRTTLGDSWTIPLANSGSGDRLSTLGVDGREVAIGLDTLRLGGFVELPLPRVGTLRLPSTTSQRLEVDGATIVVPEPNAARVLVRAGSGEFRPVELPAPLASPLLALGKDLIIPGLDGRIYLIDPRTGISTADPYVPPFDRSKPIRWRTPVLVDGSAFVLADSEATLRRIAVERSGRPRLTVTAELKLDKPLAADPASTGASILVATVDGKIRSLASRDLGPQGSLALEAPRVFGPTVVLDHVFVADSSGNVIAFAPDGRRIWSAKLRDAVPAGPPAIVRQSAWFLGRDGSIQRFAMLDGSAQSVALLDVLPVGGPFAVGPDLVVPSGRGTLRRLDPDVLESTQGAKP